MIHMHLPSVVRPIRSLERRFRQARMLTRALQSRYRPVNAHIIPIRRCNLSCGYCNEYDAHSEPVATAEMIRRVDRLAALGTGIVTLSGGEPLLHPDADEIIRRIRGHGMIATIITNGYLLTRDRIARFNSAGLDHLQISIDNVIPDDVSKKSLKVLDQKLKWLAEDATFDVTINAVVGAGTRPDDALVIARRAKELGFSITVGVIHDGHGQLAPLAERPRQVLDDIASSSTSPFEVASYNRFQRNLAVGRPNDWHCRAGARYLYICEDGLVNWCSQQRGHPGVPLSEYGEQDLEREYHTVKDCAPFCTVGCVHRVAQVDALRDRPVETLTEWFADAPGGPARVPRSIQLLKWMFISGRQRDFFRHAAARVFGAPGGTASLSRGRPES